MTRLAQRGLHSSVMKRNLRHEGFGGARAAAVRHLETSEYGGKRTTEANGSKTKVDLCIYKSTTKLYYDLKYPPFYDRALEARGQRLRETCVGYEATGCGGREGINNMRVEGMKGWMEKTIV